jgi:hypothetical protein
MELTMLERFRAKVAALLMDLAYHVSWGGWTEYIADNHDFMCEDCDHCMPDEPGYCR